MAAVGLAAVGLLVLVVICGAAGLVVYQRFGPGSESPEQVVRKALEAYIAGDYATAENYGLIRSDVGRVGKTIEIIDVEITGDTAEVVVTTWYDEPGYGEPVFIHFRLYKREGRWVIKDVWSF